MCDLQESGQLNHILDELISHEFDQGNNQGEYIYIILSIIKMLYNFLFTYCTYISGNEMNSRDVEQSIQSNKILVECYDICLTQSHLQIEGKNIIHIEFLVGQNWKKDQL